MYIYIYVILNILNVYIILNILYIYVSTFAEWLIAFMIKVFYVRNT